MEKRPILLKTGIANDFTVSIVPVILNSFFMRNRKSESKTQANSLESQTVEMDRCTAEAKQAVFDTVQNHGEELGQAFFRTFGIEAWFREYLKSTKFAELSEESKEEALNAFLGLHRFLDHIDEIHSQHHLGAYRRE